MFARARKLPGYSNHSERGFSLFVVVSAGLNFAMPLRSVQPVTSAKRFVPPMPYTIRMLAVAVVTLIVQTVASNVSTTSIVGFPKNGTSSNTYIVVFRSGSHNEQGFSPHSEFYRYLVSKGVEWTTLREYDDPILSGVTVEFDNAADLARLTEASNIETIFPDRVHAGPELGTNRSDNTWKRGPRTPPWAHVVTGVDKLHTAGYRGEDIKIAIIDTGVDYNHRLLGGGIGPDYKVIGGYDFVGDAYTGEKKGPPPQPSNYPLDQCRGHGTMMAGVIGADPRNPRGIVGVTHEAKLNVYRIFGCTGNTQSSLIVDALVRAREDGNDVINVSVNLSEGWGDSAVNMVANRIAQSGVIVTFSVGNDGDAGFWRNWQPGCELGVMSIGGAQKVARRVQDAAVNVDGITMASTSSYGPSNDMYLVPSLTAPAENTLSTYPVALGSYDTHSGGSIAAAFVAGSAALWLQKQKKDGINPALACAMFQNTAIPMHGDTDNNRLIETAARQGAGLIHVYNAVYAKNGMQPTELLLNDTANFRGSWTLRLYNMGEQPLRYTLAHVPAATIPTIDGIESIVGIVPRIEGHAIVRFSADHIVVSARSSRLFNVRFDPPVGLDMVTFPVYSGYIQATGSDGSVVRSTYLGIAAPMRQMKVLDDTSRNRELGVRLPAVADKELNVIRGPTTFSMVDKDVPKIYYRLANWTPMLRIDLISAADESLSPWARSSRSRVFRSLSGCLRRWGSLTRSRGSRSRSSCSQLERTASRLRGPRVIGTILQRTQVSRHPIEPVKEFKTYSRHKITQFRDKAPIPDGEYKLLLQVLKINGDPRRDLDWEIWASPQINIRRER